MTDFCVTWKQPDALHFNGFCTNRYRATRPPAGVRLDGGCEICLDPTSPYTECDDLPLGHTNLKCQTYSVAAGGWTDTWVRFYDLNIAVEASVYPWVFTDPWQNPVPRAAYTGRFSLRSQSRCDDWVSAEYQLNPYMGVPRFYLWWLWDANGYTWLRLAVAYRFGFVQREHLFETAHLPPSPGLKLDCRRPPPFTKYRLDGEASFSPIPPTFQISLTVPQ